MTPETRNLIKRCFITMFVLFVATGGVALLINGVAFSFGDFDLELIDVGGPAAEKRLGDWPDNLASSTVKKLSHKTKSAIDCYSSWYRVEATENAINKWVVSVHSKRRAKLPSSSKNHEKSEVVVRTIPGIPSKYAEGEKPPAWWQPPSGECRASEVMIWYKNYDSGVGQATHSIVDPATGVLWIYEFSAQHHILWRHGDTPLSLVTPEVTEPGE